MLLPPTLIIVFIIVAKAHLETLLRYAGAMRGIKHEEGKRRRRGSTVLRGEANRLVDLLHGRAVVVAASATTGSTARHAAAHATGHTTAGHATSAAFALVEL